MFCMGRFVCAMVVMAFSPLAAFQAGAAGSAQADDDKDSYEAYSVVLRQEAPAGHITAWAISEETRTYAAVDDADWCEWLS